MDENTSIFQGSIFRKLIGFSIFVIIYLLIGLLFRYTEPETSHVREVAADVVLVIFGLIFWLMFFAQFVLPVSKLKDRFKVIDRLVTYLLGGHGPAIFIENGFIRSNTKETNRKGPGVVWLDSASAAVLRTAVEFKDPIGPGVHFTNADEYIAATADLHTLSQSIGPYDSDEPFKVLESNPDYKSIKDRAETTTAITRDGIFVSASLSVSFRIKSTAGEGNTRFGFNRANTLNAIRDSMVREAKLDHPVWNTLPARMAADIWREYLGKFRFSELFEKRENRPDTTIQFINEMIKKRLTREHVELLNDYGRVVLIKDNHEQEYLHYLSEKNYAAAENLLKKVQSVEFDKLTEMGLEVKSVAIRKLFFAPDIEEQLINQWTALWLKNAQKEKQQVEIDRKYWETTGTQEGLKNFALSVSQELGRQPSAGPAHALELLIGGTHQGLQQYPEVFNRLNNEERDLTKIMSWLRNIRGSSE